MSEIGHLIREIVKPMINPPCEYGEVISVNEQNGTCTVQLDTMDSTIDGISLYCGGIEYEEKNIEGIIQNVPKEVESTVIIPSVGARCLVLFPNPIYGELVFASKIDKIYSNVGGKKLVITKEGIMFNEGENGGLIKIQELTDKINELVDWCKNHTHSNSSFSGKIGGATATGAIEVPKPIEAPKELNKSDFEDENIKH